MARRKLQTSEVITNDRVNDFRSLKDQQQSLKERLTIIEDEIKTTEIQFAEAIKKKRLAKDLKFDLSVQTIFKRFPAWKQLFVAKLGQKEADLALKKTKPQKFVHIKINKKSKIVFVE